VVSQALRRMRVTRRRSGDFGEGGLDVVGGGELGVCEGGGQERVMREGIDLARRIAHRLVEGFFAESLVEFAERQARRRRWGCWG